MPSAGSSAPAPRKATGAKRFTVAATGDVLPHDRVLRMARQRDGGYDFRPFYASIRGTIAGADVAICHQETVLGPGAPIGSPRFRGPLAIARATAATGWDACSTASNHTYDHGAHGIATTLGALDRNGIVHAGSYETRAAARRPTLLRVRGHTIALLSYTAIRNRSGYDAPGWALRTAHLARIRADARRARRAGAQAVIVSLHWGHDYEARPGPRRLARARRLLGLRSVSALIGQGPHLVWPIRYFHRKPAVMSEGNLLYEHDPRNQGGQESGVIALLRFHSAHGRLSVGAVRYLPLLQRRSDLRALLAGVAAGAPGLARAARGAYRHAVNVIGRSARVGPLPPRLPAAR